MSAVNTVMVGGKVDGLSREELIARIAELESGKATAVPKAEIVVTTFADGGQSFSITIPGAKAIFGQRKKMLALEQFARTGEIGKFLALHPEVK